MQRPWHIPAPPPGGLDAVDGAAVLREDFRSLGLVLWDLARDALRWLDTAPEDACSSPSHERTRRTVANDRADEPELASILLLLTGMLADRRSGSRRAVALHCAHVSAAAEREGAPATALLFAEVAGRLSPEDAELAYRVGRLARRNADYGRAQTWLRQAILLGRHNGDVLSYGRAYSGLGNLAIQRGDYPRARRYHRKALGIARRYELRELEGQALHDLCGIAVEAGELDQAEWLARQACVAYGHGHPRLPILAHDVAYAWMNAGYFRLALRVFEATLLHYVSVEEQLDVLSDLCRAAAGAGDLPLYEQWWKKTWAAIATTSVRDHVAQALVELARASSSAGHWSRAETAARMALGLAVERHEARIRLTAEALLDSIRADQTAAERLAIGRPAPIATPTAAERKLGDYLISYLAGQPTATA